MSTPLDDWPAFPIGKIVLNDKGKKEFPEGLPKGWQHTKQKSRDIKGNGGIVPGPKRAVVDIDDSPRLEELKGCLYKLKATTLQETQSGMLQAFFYCPDAPEGNAIFFDDGAGEIRKGNAFVIRPDSKTEQGTEWKYKNSIEVATVSWEEITNAFAQFLKGEKKAVTATKANKPKVEKTAWKILKEPHPTEKERVSCVMKLYNANTDKGWSNNEICDYIDRHNTWEDYDKDFTAEKVEYASKYFNKEEPAPVAAPSTQPKEKVTMEELRETFNKWLKMKNDWIVDLCSAVAINRLTTSETSLWVFIIGTSGISKTEIVRAFEDPIGKTTKPIRRLTKNTFISGRQGIKHLAPELKGKLLITTDTATLQKLDAKEKSLVWAQMRDLYDGNAGRQTGSGVDIDFTGLTPIPWLFNATPSIDNELLLHQTLGTRELIFRIQTGWFSERDVMEKIFSNKKQKVKMREEMHTKTRGFIDQFTEQREIEINNDVKKELKQKAKLITLLRASAEVDSYTGELENFVYPEMPTRILEQLIELYNCLKNLSPEYPDERALEIINHVCLSSIHPIRVKVFQEVMDGETKATNHIKRNVGLGWKTVVRELYILKNLGVVQDEENEPDSGYGRSTYYWTLTDTPNSKLLKNYLKTGQFLLEEFEEVAEVPTK